MVHQMNSAISDYVNQHYRTKRVVLTDDVRTLETGRVDALGGVRLDLPAARLATFITAIGISSRGRWVLTARLPAFHDAHPVELGCTDFWPRPEPGKARAHVARSTMRVPWFLAIGDTITFDVRNVDTLDDLAFLAVYTTTVEEWQK